MLIILAFILGIFFVVFLLPLLQNLSDLISSIIALAISHINFKINKLGQSLNNNVESEPVKN